MPTLDPPVPSGPPPSGGPAPPRQPPPAAAVASSAARGPPSASSAEADDLRRQLIATRGELEAAQKALSSARDENKQLRAAAGDGAADRIKELEKMALAKSKEVVEQGEKNLTLQQKTEKLQKQAREAKEEMDRVRAQLITHIVGEDANPAKFKNVKVDDLIRLRLKSDDAGGGGGASEGKRGGGGGGGGAASSPSRGAGGGGGGDGDDEGKTAAIVEADRVIKALRARNVKLNKQLEQQADHIKQLQVQVQDIDYAKARAQDQAARVRHEKSERARAEDEIQRSMEKVEALSEHIEKLMVHLKHEAASKAKAYEAQRRAEKEVTLLKNRNSALARKNAARDKIINELKEGSKILEDQLRLMDEKYIELRAKLDWTRQHSAKEVSRVTKEANKLRAKVMMVSALGHEPMSGRSSHRGGGSARGSTSGGYGTAPMTAPGTAGSYGSRPAQAGNSAMRPMSVPALPPGMGGGGDPDADPADPWSTGKVAQLSRNYSQ